MENDEIEVGLEILKKEYTEFKVKYNLPDFYELNKLFDIEEIDADTDFLLRKIRRVVLDKVGNYLRFIEVMLNPSNAPIFFFKLIKKLDEKDKQDLTELYEELGKIELDVVRLDLDYNESREAEFINKIFMMFNERIKQKLLVLIHKMGNGEDKKKEDVGSSYCG